MKTFKTFQQDLDESALRLGLKLVSKLKKPVVKTLKHVFKKKPSRTIDPYFAQKAFSKGTAIKGFHGSSQKKINQYFKTGVQPAKSGTYKIDKSDLAWAKKSNWKPTSATSGKDAYFTTDPSRAQQYAKRGSNYENSKPLNKIKNLLTFGKTKDKGAVTQVMVKNKSVRSTWKDLSRAPGASTEKIANAKDIIPIKSGPSARVAKDRLKIDKQNSSRIT